MEQKTKKNKMPGRKPGRPVKQSNPVVVHVVQPANNNEYKCTCCGVAYKMQSGNFMKSNSALYKNNNEYITVCRLCVDNYYKKMLGFYNGNVNISIERCCQLFDIYYHEKAVESTGKDATESRMLSYPAKLNMTQYRGRTYFDTMLDCQNRIPVNNNADTVSEEQLETYRVSPETIKLFGHGYNIEDYEYLEEQYNDWTSRYQCETKAQEELAKTICIAQLSIRKTQNSGDVTKIANAMKTWQDLIKTADLTPQRNASNAVGQNTFGTLIKRLESEQPVMEPLEEWKDVDGLYHYINTFFFGQLCDLAHLQNPKENEYREEKAKHSITPQEIEDSGYAFDK